MKEGDACFAGSLIAIEIHILDDCAETLGRNNRRRLVRRRSGAARNVVKLAKNSQRLNDRRLVVDDEHRQIQIGHLFILSIRLDGSRSHLRRHVGGPDGWYQSRQDTREPKEVRHSPPTI